MQRSVSRKRARTNLWSGVLKIRFLGTLLAALPAIVFALNNGVARTPPMGWNDWNQFGVISRSLITVIGDSLVSTGLRDVGYVYVNRDGGNPRPRSTTFVSTWKPISDNLHAKGLKFGCYLDSTDNATETVKKLDSAGIDFIKFDGWVFQNCDHQYTEMRDALMASARPIVYSTNTCSDSNICNMYRTGRDIDPNWPVVMECFDAGSGHTSRARPGFWPDPDIMEVGVSTEDGQLTDTENRAHFSMWCIMAAPLIAGFDFTNTRVNLGAQAYARIIEIHGNAEVVAVNQDPLGRGGRRLRGQGALEVWVKDLADSTKAVALFNRTGSASTMSVTATDLGWGSAPQIYVRDLWLHAMQAPFSGTFSRTVASHAAEVYRMSRTPIAEPVEVLRTMDRNIAWLEKNGVRLFRRGEALSVMRGSDPRVRVFDLRGKALPIELTTVGAGVFLLRAGTTPWPAAKTVWPGDAVSQRQR